MELHERQRGEKVTQTAKNLLRCHFSSLLCSTEGSGRGWVTAWLLLPAERGGTEGGRCRMSSCEGAGTFWAGRNIDAAVQGFLQSWLFPQNPVSLRCAAPCVDSNKAAQEGLALLCGSQGDLHSLALAGRGMAAHGDLQTSKEGGRGDTSVLGSPGVLVHGAGPTATLHGLEGLRDHQLRCKSWEQTPVCWQCHPVPVM